MIAPACLRGGGSSGTGTGGEVTIRDIRDEIERESGIVVENNKLLRAVLNLTGAGTGI